MHHRSTTAPPVAIAAPPAFPTGRWMITIVALILSFGSFLADWNETHIFNPHWLPHAKFHTAQTMAMGTWTSVLALWLLWRRQAEPYAHLLAATLFASSYPLTQLAAVFFPETALFDPGYPNYIPVVAGVQITQPFFATAMVAIIATGYLLEYRRMHAADQASTTTIHDNRHPTHNKTDGTALNDPA